MRPAFHLSLFCYLGLLGTVLPAHAADKGGGSYDFCSSMEDVIGYGQMFLGHPQVPALLDLMDPVANADVNGGFRVGSQTDIDGLKTFPNGIPDVSGELRVLQTILNDPGFDNGVLDHPTVAGIFAANKAQLEADFNQPDDVLLYPGLFTVFAAFLTLGGGSYEEHLESVEVSPGSFDFWVERESTGNTGGVRAVYRYLGGDAYDLDPTDYTAIPELQVYGDADGDGASNLCEYASYPLVSCGATPGGEIDYVTAALDPSVTPPACAPLTEEDDTEGEGSSDGCTTAAIPNGDFESGNTDWITGGGALIETTYGNTNAGIGAAYLLFDSSGGPDTLSQDVTIPTAPYVELRFALQTVRSDTAFAVRIDGDTIFTAANVLSPAFREIGVDVTAYADGNAHTLTFAAQASASKADTYLDGINLDDVSFALCPTGPEPEPTACPTCPPSTYTVLGVGDSLCLRVPDPVSSLSTFVWSKDGVALEEGRVEGVTCRSLYIDSLLTSDSGTYTCTYNDASKALATYSVTIEVAPNVPASSFLTLLVLTLLLAGAVAVKGTAVRAGER